jgi:DNA-directed RNA polymerase specialized sigma subunit
MFRKDEKSFDILLDRFNDYLFKIHAISYIKSSVQEDVKHVKKEIFKQIKINAKELTLNSNSDDFAEDNVSNIRDYSVDFIETITKDSMNFKEIITDKELLDSIASLSDKQREVLFLLFLKNLDEKLIANQRNVSVQSVNKTKLKALNHLRADWGCKHGSYSRLNK